MSNFPLRLPRPLLDEAKALAKSDGVSMNAFLSALVAERVGERRALAQLQARAVRADIDQALAVLDRVPVRTPLPGDERV
jgi:hypothetical protein